MFRKCLLFSLLFPSFLLASINTFFDEEEPAVVHHINVISGQLNLFFEDAQIKGAVPFQLSRTFTSGGALEGTEENKDLEQKKERGTEWMLQGGWTFLPHANLHLKVRKYRGTYYLSATVREKSGQYLYFKGDTSHIDKAKLKFCGEDNSTVVNPRKNPNFAKIKIEGKKAVLSLPDGGERHYKGEHHAGWKILTRERLPSGHWIRYHYTNKSPKQLKAIEVKSPDLEKTFSSIQFSDQLFKTERKLIAKTSDGVSLTYLMSPEIKERTYLHQVKSSTSPLHTAWYEPGRKGTGAWLRSIDLYSNKLKTWIFGCAKATQFADRNRPYIINIRSVTIGKFRQLSRCEKTKF